MTATKDVLTTGQLARQTGVHLETVRFYEKSGLLPKPARTHSGYRQFKIEDARRIRFIKRAQELGFTLKETRELLSLWTGPRVSSARVKRIAEEKLADIELKIRDLTRMKKALGQINSACHGHGTTERCPILKALEQP